MLWLTIRMACVGMLPVVHSSSSSPRSAARAEHVQGGEGFVQAEQLRLHGHGPGKAYLLPHAARQLARIGVLEAVQPHAVQQVHRA